MQHKKRKWKLGRRAVVAAISAGAVFQVSSCNIDDGRVISAFVDTGALSDLRNQLFEASLLGRLLGDIEGSLEVSIGEDE